MIRGLAALALLALCAEVAAHPFGNNTVNRQASLTVSPHQVRIEYRLDLAEIPALAAAIEADGDGDGQTMQAEWDGWAAAREQAIRRALALSINRKSAALTPGRREWQLLPGQAGLDTLRLHLGFHAAIGENATHLELAYRDDFQASRAGWQEIRIVGLEGMVVTAADVPQRDRSKGLTDFTLTDGDLSPRELAASAHLRFDPAAVASSPDTAADSSGSEQDAGGRTSAATGRWTAAWHFYRLGLHHIAAGFDHLAFLLGLLLSARRLAELIQVITAFTLAHSLTLALAASGWIVAPGELVEPAIAASIVYVGARSLTGKGRSHGVYLAFGFGLVHGLGFAGALAESLAGGIPSGRYWISDLAAFNLGIESLQLLVAAIAFALLQRCRRRPWAGPVTATASAAVMTAGMGWLVLRVVSP